MGYMDVMMAAVPSDRKQAYSDYSRKLLPLFKEHGATSYVDNWGDDVPEGKVTDLRRAVAAEPGESVAVGWIGWPDKATRDAAWAALMQDERMKPGDMPFDGKRMIFGGFETLVEA